MKTKVSAKMNKAELIPPLSTRSALKAPKKIEDKASKKVEVKASPAKKVVEPKKAEVKVTPAKKVSEPKKVEVKAAPAKKAPEPKKVEVKPTTKVKVVVEKPLAKVEPVAEKPAPKVKVVAEKPELPKPVVEKKAIKEKPAPEIIEEKVEPTPVDTKASVKPKGFTTTLTSYPDKINYRLSQVYYHLNQEKVKGVYVNYLPNIKYLTGFTGSQADLIVFKDSIHFFTDDRYEEQIKTELYPLPNLQTHITRDLWAYIAQIGLLDTVDAILFESDKVSYYDAVEFRNKIRPCKFKPFPNLVEPFTTSKANEEVELIRQSCKIAETVYEKIMQYIKPGMTEKEIANEISYLGRKLGSEGEAFDIIVTSGIRGAIIHGQPSEKKIRKGDIVLMDFGFKVKGFSSDISRTICVGAKPTREQRHLYSTLREAEMKVIRAVLPGMNGKTMDAIVRKVISDAGYESIAYKHSLGHGLGIMTHEHPFLNSRQEGQIVPEDAVLAIEPGAYIPEKYGMRVEDNILVTKNGAIMLTNAPDELPYIL
jgi:Xaa-Pro aminopeptidase